MTERKCHLGIGQCVEGDTLVAHCNFSVRYDFDLTIGIFSRPNHDLAGESYVGKMLVFNTANTILAQGATLADLTMEDRFEDYDVTDLIRSGDRIRVDPEIGVVTVLGRRSPD